MKKIKDLLHPIFRTSLGNTWESRPKNDLKSEIPSAKIIGYTTLKFTHECPTPAVSGDELVWGCPAGYSAENLNRIGRECWNYFFESVQPVRRVQLLTSPLVYNY